MFLNVFIMIVHETMSVETPVEVRGHLLGVSSLLPHWVPGSELSSAGCRASTLSHGVGPLQTLYLIGTCRLAPDPPQVPLLGKDWPLRRGWKTTTLYGYFCRGVISSNSLEHPFLLIYRKDKRIRNVSCFKEFGI